ncbi:MAG: ArsR/SmtB family transcription factor [Pleomorphochaeta sp.]
MEITNIIKIFSDQNRLRIINLIKDDLLCVGEIQTILNIKQSNVSRHLEKLKALDILIQQKQAQWIYYKLDKEKLKQYAFITDLLYQDINNSQIYKEDLSKLEKYKNSKMCCQNLRDIGFDFNKLNFKK